MHKRVSVKQNNHSKTFIGGLARAWVVTANIFGNPEWLFWHPLRHNTCFLIRTMIITSSIRTKMHPVNVRMKEFSWIYLNSLEFIWTYSNLLQFICISFNLRFLRSAWWTHGQTDRLTKHLIELHYAILWVPLSFIVKVSISAIFEKRVTDPQTHGWTKPLDASKNI